MKRLLALVLVMFIVESQISKLFAVQNYFETCNAKSVSGRQNPYDPVISLNENDDGDLKFSQLTDIITIKNENDHDYAEDEMKIILRNPYQNIDWTTIKSHRANLHCHSLQSDGYHRVKEVIETYKNAGFTILSITDHDWNWPNARVTWGHLPVEEASPYPIGPLPENFPANPTWPWTDYGAHSPEEFGMVGIQGNELTFRHHINSYFSDYGVWYQRTGRKAPYGGITDKDGNIIWEDNQLFDIWNKGGVAVINHPSVLSNRDWWERKPLEWYVERFQKHSASYLIGIEVTNNGPETEKYDEALWDQLLARFMPERPIWGFGNDDMHSFELSNNTHTVFLLNNLSTEAVREAMEKGQFYFCKSNRKIDLRKEEIELFPSINKIEVDEINGTITIEASNYDKIKWISSPLSLDPIDDYEISNQPWPLGHVVHEGNVLNYKTIPNVKNYIRIELHRIEGENIYRTFTNPIGIYIFR